MTPSGLRILLGTIIDHAQYLLVGVLAVLVMALIGGFMVAFFLALKILVDPTEAANHGPAVVFLSRVLLAAVLSFVLYVLGRAVAANF